MKVLLYRHTSQVGNVYFSAYRKTSTTCTFRNMLSEITEQTATITAADENDQQPEKGIDTDDATMWPYVV